MRVQPVFLKFSARNTRGFELCGDLNFTAQEQAFRGEVRQFLREHLPARFAHKVRHALHITRGDALEWHAILNASRAISRPVRHPEKRA